MGTFTDYYFFQPFRSWYNMWALNLWRQHIYLFSKNSDSKYLFLVFALFQKLIFFALLKILNKAMTVKSSMGIQGIKVVGPKTVYLVRKNSPKSRGKSRWHGVEIHLFSRHKKVFFFFFLNSRQDEDECETFDLV